MNIYPVHSEQADRRHWVVRLLRYMGYLLTVGCVITGAILGRGMLWRAFEQYFNLPMDMAAALGALLGALLGFWAGMLAGLPLWALALITDDIHASRVYLSGFAAIDDRTPTP